MTWRGKLGNMVECYKVSHGYYDLQTILNFNNKLGLRGHSLNPKNEFARTSVRNHFFAEGVTNVWN